MYRIKYVFVFFCVITSSCLNIEEPIDLTWPFDETSIYWPGVNSFVYTRKIAEFKADGSWYAMNEFCAGEHGGTHLDAPFHFNYRGWKVGDIPMNRLIAKAILIDISHDVEEKGPQTLLSVEHLKKWEQRNGILPENCIILVRFGWAKYYKKYEEYMGINGSINHFPGISGAAARWIADTEKVFGVGVDTASVDAGSSTDFKAHKILSEKQIYAMENVNIPKLPETGFNLMVMPMKLKDGSGAPLRVIATPASKLLEMQFSHLSSHSSVPWYGHTSVVLCSLLLLAMYSINSFT